MNIYLISQDTNTDYDSYDSAVVIAKQKKRLEKSSQITATFTGYGQKATA